MKKQHAINEEEAAASAQDGNFGAGIQPGERVERALRTDGEGDKVGRDVDSEEDKDQIIKEHPNMYAPRNDEASSGYDQYNTYDRGRSYLISEHPNMKVPTDGSQEDVDRFKSHLGEMDTSRQPFAKNNG